MNLSGKSIEYNSPAFKEIFNRLYPSVCMLATRILQDGHKGQDIAQEAFIKLWENDKEEFTSEDSLRAYLYVLIKNACLTHLRKKSRVSYFADISKGALPKIDVMNEVLREETYQLLHNAIDNLSPQAAQVINLSMIGYTSVEIADELGVSLNTIKTVKKRAYKALRKSIGNHFVVFLLMTAIRNF
ncbi:MAG: RNA polymerase sigma factor [Bacteroidales bacterium]|nr:RNA polymerase sigma factor [Bacteroidales bacterium]